MDDTVLVSQALKGDKSAFEKLYNKYSIRLFKFVYYRVGSTDTTQDLCSEIWYQALKSLKSFKGASQFYTWLVSIAKNLLNQFYKSKYSSALELLEDHYIQNEVIETNKNAENLAKKIINSLSDIPKKIITLRYLNGYKMGEIAEVLGLTEVNVKVIHHRTIRKLQKNYGGANLLKTV